MTRQRTYDFDDQFSHGKHGEAFLDRFFARWFHILPATDAEQRQGIDRHFRHRKSHQTFTVEYKTDDVATRTGNAFIETISVDTEEKAGWAFTSQSDMLLYYVPGKQVVYVVPFTALRARLPFWMRTYEERAVANNGYPTHGLLLPLEEFGRCAERVLMCDD